MLVTLRVKRVNGGGGSKEVLENENIIEYSNCTAQLLLNLLSCLYRWTQSETMINCL